jgi:hypothetical protein
MSAPDKKRLKNVAMRDIHAVEAVLRRWDPIGVEPGSMAPADEYDSYAPYLVSMVRNGCTLDEVTSRLEYLATETMGLGPSSPQSRERSRGFAAQIIESVRPSNTSLERTRDR